MRNLILILLFIGQVAFGEFMPIGSGGGGGGASWGSITGTLSAQTDLNTALGLKAPLDSPAFTTQLTCSYATASTVPYLDASKHLISSAVTPTQLGFLDATSSIQTQLNGKQASGSYAASGANSDITSMSGLTTSNAISTPKTINMGDGTGTAQITFDNGTVSRNHAFQIKAVNNSDTQYFGFDGGQNAWFMFDSGTNVNYRFATQQLECGSNVLKMINDTDVNMDLGSSTKRMKNAYVARGVAVAEFAASPSAIDFNNGAAQVLTVTANTTFTFANPISGVGYDLRIIQDATGGWTYTWPAAVRWTSNASPLPSAAGQIDLVHCDYKSDTHYYCQFQGNYAP